MASLGKVIGKGMGWACPFEHGEGGKLYKMITK